MAWFELANTIRQIQGVGSASVQLVLPDDNDALFTEDAPQPSAAVLLGAADIDPSAVQGIARLVASSVKSLRPQNVTITDGAGHKVGGNILNNILVGGGGEEVVGVEVGHRVVIELGDHHAASGGGSGCRRAACQVAASAPDGIRILPFFRNSTTGTQRFSSW